MPRPESKTASAQALVGLWAIALTAFVIVRLCPLALCVAFAAGIPLFQRGNHAKLDSRNDKPEQA